MFICYELRASQGRKAFHFAQHRCFKEYWNRQKRWCHYDAAGDAGGKYSHPTEFILIHSLYAFTAHEWSIWREFLVTRLCTHSHSSLHGGALGCKCETDEAISGLAAWIFNEWNFNELIKYEDVMHFKDVHFFFLFCFEYFLTDFLMFCWITEYFIFLCLLKGCNIS